MGYSDSKSPASRYEVPGPLARSAARNGRRAKELWPTVPIQHAKSPKHSLDTRPKPLKPRFRSSLRDQSWFWLEARLHGRYTLFLGHTPELCDVIAGGNAHIEQKRTRCSMAL